jgi:sarcosine oxidase
VRIAQQAVAYWNDLQDELDSRLLVPTGALDFGPEAELTAVRSALSAVGVPFTSLSEREAGDRFPTVSLPTGWGAVYQSDGGILLAERALRGAVTLAQRAGAEVRAETAALGIDLSAAGALVTTPNGQIEAGSVVVAGAAWSNRLLEPLGLAVPLKVTREHVAYYAGASGEKLPPFICRPGNGGRHFYGLPDGSRDLFKIGEHGAGPETDVDAEQVVDSERLEPVHTFVRRHLPYLVQEPYEEQTCLYAGTPDDDFVVDRSGPVVLGLGFGGHGFKFAPLVGALLADLAQGLSPALPARFRRSRFQSARPTVAEPRGAK